MLKKLGLLLLCGASLFAMNDVELNINDKDLEFAVKFDMGQFVNSVEPELVFIGAKILNGSEKHSSLSANNPEGLSDYYEFSFLMKRQIDGTPLSIGLGVKLNATDKFVSIPLGVEIGYIMPFVKTIPMSLHLDLYYAPDVLSLSDAKNFLEYRISYDIEVIKNAVVTMGYRILTTDYISGESPYLREDVKYNSSPYIGFRFLF